MIIIYVPCKDVNEAKIISRTLIHLKLAICINIIPIIYSIYRWEGKVEEDKETLIIIKTSKQKKDSAIKMIKKTHSFKTPDLVFWETEKDVKWLLPWIKQELSK